MVMPRREEKKKGYIFRCNPLKYLAERKRFELLVPFGYTRFPIVLLKPGSETSPRQVKLLVQMVKKVKRKNIFFAVVFLV